MFFYLIRLVPNLIIILDPHKIAKSQFLFKPVFFMRFLPHFWVKIGSKTGKMHRLYIKTCALNKLQKYTDFIYKTCN
jgi:hypothetical protein